MLANHGGARGGARATFDLDCFLRSHRSLRVPPALQSKGARERHVLGRMHAGAVLGRGAQRLWGRLAGWARCERRGRGCLRRRRWLGGSGTRGDLGGEQGHDLRPEGLVRHRATKVFLQRPLQLAHGDVLERAALVQRRAGVSHR